MDGNNPYDDLADDGWGNADDSISTSSFDESDYFIVHGANIGGHAAINDVQLAGIVETMDGFHIIDNAQTTYNDHDIDGVQSEDDVQITGYFQPVYYHQANDDDQDVDYFQPVYYGQADDDFQLVYYHQADDYFQPVYDDEDVDYSQSVYYPQAGDGFQHPYDLEAHYYVQTVGDFQHVYGVEDADDGQFAADDQHAYVLQYRPCYHCLKLLVECDPDGPLPDWCQKMNEFDAMCTHCIDEGEECHPLDTLELRIYADYFRDILSAPVFNDELFKYNQKSAQIIISVHDEIMALENLMDSVMVDLVAAQRVIRPRSWAYGSAYDSADGPADRWLSPWDRGGHSGRAYRRRPSWDDHRRSGSAFNRRG